MQVWDLNPRASNPKQTIQTVFSVGRLQWQPGNPTRIASAASLFDCQIHVWFAGTSLLYEYSVTATTNSKSPNSLAIPIYEGTRASLTSR